MDLTSAALIKFTGSTADALVISTPFGTMTLDRKTAAEISQQTAGDITITAAKAEVKELTAAIRKKIGDRPAVRFDIIDKDKQSIQADSHVTVTIPYTPKAGENPKAIAAYVVNATGKLEAVTKFKYDPAAGAIIFNTPYASTYAIGYNKVNFADVADAAWYYDAVTFAATREITAGTGNGNFGSNEPVTRAQALVMMMKAFGIKPDANAESNFSDAGDSYYTGYLAAAKRLGISSGVGGNLFAPDRPVTRQEMLVLVYHTLKSIDELPAGTTGKDLQDFKDAEDVAGYANEAVDLFIKTGIIAGSNENILPAGNASRAQFVQILYNIMTK